MLRGTLGSGISALHPTHRSNMDLMSTYQPEAISTRDFDSLVLQALNWNSTTMLLALATIVGFLPATTAYRTDVADALG